MAMSDARPAAALPLLSADRLLAAAGCLAVIAVSIVLCVRAGTVSDVSWIIHVIERLASGQRLYVDIMEANPPFTIWLYEPVVRAANALSVPPEIAVYVFAYAAVFAGFALTILIVRRGGLVSATARWWLWPTLLAILLILRSVPLPSASISGWR